MNLFITSKSAKKSAEYLSQDSIRLNKQILECNQILATALFLNNADERFMPFKKNGSKYKPYHACKCNIPLLSFAGNCFMKPKGFFKFHNETPYKNIPVFEAYKKHLNDKWSGKYANN
jgi:hypothetical protein